MFCPRTPPIIKISEPQKLSPSLPIWAWQRQRNRPACGTCRGRPCPDETSKQLIAETRTPIPMKRGRAARIDYEYERNGTANLFMLFAPLEGWRHVEVTDRHTAVGTLTS